MNWFELKTRGIGLRAVSGQSYMHFTEHALRLRQNLILAQYHTLHSRLIRAEDWQAAELLKTIIAEVKAL